ncbi:MAG: Inner membrane protein YbhL [Alphaproteobacteria bacterium MarineAlpha11_Bin1]|nr:MAG: Inner membrane protein YbhL [Alphaproteobacteria bacterium MarineAlpha11_Bin1]|tara:strand:+ start:19957 stop:20712 length:756 start_codon:yes stop_codon:yes gene_type:complete
MAFGSEKTLYTGVQVDQAEFDAGLRAHMLRVYNYMVCGLLLTGILAVVVAQMSVVTNDAGQIVGLTGLGQTLFGSPLKWVVMLAPLGMVFFLSARLHAMKQSTAQAVFWIYAAMMGISMATIFMAFTGASIARVFFITAGTFAGMSLWAYTTKKDLSGWGSFLMMGVIGIVIAMIVNMFIGSSALQSAISVIGVLVFVGLTAYDTQNIKNEYAEHFDEDTKGKLAISGALRLYLDFINLFIMLLHLFGNRD